jgi:hypothetical protein
MKNKIILIAISILLIFSYSPDVYAKRKKKGEATSQKEEEWDPFQLTEAQKKEFKESKRKREEDANKPFDAKSVDWTGMDGGTGPGAASTARFDSRYTEMASYYNLNPFAQPSKEELERMLLEYNIKKYGKYVGMLIGIFLIIFIIKNILKKQGQ